MRTDDLINLLVADQPPPSPPLARRLGLALAAGFVVSAVLFFLGLGPRPDIAAVVTTPRFLFKIIEALLLATAAATLVVQLSKPAARTRNGALALTAVLALLLAAVGIELLLVPTAQWSGRLIGSNARICLTAIPLLSLPLLAAALFALRHGAPTKPALAGAVAGLLSSGLAAALYATHCTDDSPLFVATWYTIAVVLVSAIGSAAGRFWLRW